MTEATQIPTLEVENLAIRYKTRAGFTQAVRDVSFVIQPGETFGLVGESGCGKSTVAFGIVNFLGRNGQVNRGDVRFQGRSLLNRTEEELKQLRGNAISMVYQDPMQSLNPSMKIGEQLSEVLIDHQGLRSGEARQRCLEMLARVYMPDPELVIDRYPHQISGGQQQRVVIAMALLNRPALLILDEPTTALDVTVEAAVIDLISELRRDFEMSILFITHNLGIMARLADQLGVMYAGELVESSACGQIFKNPQHPYTQGLLRCLPKMDRSKTQTLYSIPGRVPSPAEMPPGCAFEPRCPHARPECQIERPIFRLLDADHFARCLFSEQITAQEGAKIESIPAFADSFEISSDDVLQIENLKTYYEHKRFSPLALLGLGKKTYVRAVDEVSLSLSGGTTLGIVGESGCGKSTLAKTIIGLEQPIDGDLRFLDVEIDIPVHKRSLEIIQQLQIVFQNPDSVLNPSYTIGHQISRPIRRFKVVPPNEVRAEVMRLLKAVGLGEHYYERLPRQLSGGEKQRVGIARALAGRPELVICDEPVSALDVSVQSAILNLLTDIQRELHTTLIFIAHDLSVVRYLSDLVGVMYLGKIVEFGTVEQVYSSPYHPYTQALLSAVPIPDPDIEQDQIRLTGEVPSALNPPSGCRFHGNCHLRVQMMGERAELCAQEEPPWREPEEGHRIACHIPLEQLEKIGLEMLSR